MLDSAPRLLYHYLLATSVVESLSGLTATFEFCVLERVVAPTVAGPVRYRQIQRCRIAEQEHGDVQNPRVNIGWVGSLW
jgi:hypothetical protein